MPENRTPHRLALIVLVTAGAINPAHASPGLCEDAARIAAREAAIPEQVMLAITLVETARDLDGAPRPWPWAVHASGSGHWFPSRPAAIRHVTDVMSAQIDNIDIGCFQINLRWHGASFTNPEQMFDPLANARHAARFLSQLHRETGDWLLAAGAYHSRTPALAERYRGRIAAMLARLDAAPRVQTRQAIASSSPLAAPSGRPILVPAQGALLALHSARTPLLRAAAMPLTGG